MATSFAVVGEEYPTISDSGLKSHGTKLSSPVAMIDRQYATPSGGTGYLAGEYPAGTTTVEGVPQSATVRVHYRPSNKGNIGDGVLVAEVESDPDGTWRVDGLDSHKRYDVIGRKDGFNDVIMANIKPYDLQRFAKHEYTVTVAKPLALPLPIIGGEGEVIASIASGSLPSGVTLVNNILIGSWPTGATGEYVVTFDLTDDEQTLQDTITLELVVLPLAIVGDIPEVIPKDEAFSLQLVATGGEAPYTFSVSSGTLPSGLTLSSAGLLSGTPDTATGYTFTVHVEDTRSSTQIRLYEGIVSAEIVATFRYYRINITANNGGTYAVIAEVEIFYFSSGDLTSPSGTISASSIANGSNHAGMAFDNSAFNKWAANTTTGWLQYDFGATQSITGIRVMGNYSSGDQASFAPKDFTLLGSNDGSAWTTLISKTGETSWGAAEFRTYYVGEGI